MQQIPLPLGTRAGADPSRIVVGSANSDILDVFAHAKDWPFRTAILSGPPRSGKSLLAKWFRQSGLGEAIDNADRCDEAELFHLWNRAQESDRPLLLVSNVGDEGWAISLPDLRSRLAAALHLEIGSLDDQMTGDLLMLHAELRGLALGPDAITYLVPRAERSHIGIERLVSAIDRLSLERKHAPTLAIWRDALAEVIDSHAQTLR